MHQDYSSSQNTDVNMLSARLQTLHTDVSDIKFALDSLDKGVEEQKVLVLVSDVRV